jgi:hypothetical protein
VEAGRLTRSDLRFDAVQLTTRNRSIAVASFSARVQAFVSFELFHTSLPDFADMGVSDAVVQSDVQPPNDLAGWSRSRTCNQTVMSDGTMVSFVDFAAFSFEFDRVRCVLARSFLVRNWCGLRPSVEAVGGQSVAAGASAIGREAEAICSS